MKKQLMTLALCIALLITVITPPVTYSKENGVPFQDIENHWAKDTIIKMYDLGFVKGKTVDQFAPNDTLTVAELITMINRMFSLDEKAARGTYTGQWYDGELEKATYYEYCPEEVKDFNQPATRMMCMELINQIIDTDDYDMFGDYTVPFSDINDLNEEQRETVFAFYENEYIRGDGQGKLNPFKALTRAEMVTIFNNILGYIVKDEEDALNIPNGFRNVTVIDDGITIKNKEMGYLFVSQGVEDFTAINVKADTARLFNEGGSYITNSEINTCIILHKTSALKDTYLSEETKIARLVTDFSEDIINKSNYINEEDYILVDPYYADELSDESTDTYQPKRYAPKTRCALSNKGWNVDDGGDYIGIWSVEDFLSIEDWGMNEQYVLMVDLDLANQTSYRDINDTSFGDYNGDGVVEGIYEEVTGDIDGVKRGFKPIGAVYKTREEMMDDYIDEAYGDGESESPKFIFNGIFEGAHHTITNVYINTDLDDVGLFYWIGEGEIKNLILEDIHYICNLYEVEYDLLNQGGVSQGNIGGITSRNGGKLSNCSVTGTILVHDTLIQTNKGVNLGGIDGYNGGTVTGCKADVYMLYQLNTSESVTEEITPSLMGGIVGDNRGVISECEANGTITSYGEHNYVGGIVGGTSEAVSKCKASNTLYIKQGLEKVKAGGIFGLSLAFYSDTVFNHSDSEFSGIIKDVGDI